MSKGNRKICRLCLKSVYENDFDMKEEITKYMFEELLLKLDLEISVEPVMCKECKEDLQTSFDFKLRCLSLNNRLLPFKSLIGHDRQEGIDVSEDDDLCHICKTKEKCLTALCESHGNVIMFEMLQKHIPELITEKVIICSGCLQSVAVLFKFVTNCLNVEEKIKKYVDLKQIGKDQIDLNDIQQFTYKMPLNTETEMKPATALTFEIKNELDERIKEEEIIVKDEIENTSLVETDELECGIEDGQTEPKQKENNSFEDTPQPPSSILKPIYKCIQCKMTTMYKSSIKKHVRMHRSDSKITKGRGTILPYETLFTTVPLYQCKLCTFKTEFVSALRLHTLVHLGYDKTETFNCNICTFKSKTNCLLDRHMKVHKLSEDVLYRCTICAVETKSKQTLDRHMLVHNNPTEITWYKCDLCPLATYLKDYFDAHVRKHKVP